MRTAAIVILAILGHGLLMASSVDATEGPHDASHAGHAVAADPSLDWPAHDGSCFTVQAAVKAAPLPLQPDRSVAPFPEPLLRDVVPPSQAAITPPHQPPNVVRALLQVYRM